jgi:hypothetical protein
MMRFQHRIHEANARHVGIAPESRDRELWRKLARPVSLFDEPSPTNFLTGQSWRILWEIDNLHRTFGSLRWRYFGPRALIEDNSQRSKATSLFELEAGYQLAKKLRVTAQVFNLLNSAMSDVDYYVVSRLPGEPVGGLPDVMTHPTLSRSARVTLVEGF